MAATVEIHEYNSASGTRTDKTSGTVRFKNADDATVDLNNPLVKPTSGQEYSYEKWLRLVAYGQYTQITNLQCYTDGSNGLGTGVLLWYAITGTYVQPVVPSEAADPPQSPAAGSPVENMADAFGLTSGSPGDLDGINTGPFTPLSPNADEQPIGDFLVLVMEVNSTASAGTTATETLTFSWDEI